MHLWLGKYHKEGLAGLADHSHRPHYQPRQLHADIEAVICQLRRAHPRWGPRRLRYELGKANMTPVPARSTVYRVLVRHGLVAARKRKRRRQDYKRWQREEPMQLWQLDITGSVFLTGGTELKLISGIDDHSRFCVIASVVRRATARAVCRAFVAAMMIYGIPDEVLSDNGKQFTGRFGKPRPAEVLFERICRRNGIRQLLTKPYSPTTTGKVERWHQTLQVEFLNDAGPFASIEQAQAAVDKWREEYNHQRPHQSLDMAAPADKFRPSPATDGVLSLWAPADIVPVPSLASTIDDTPAAVTEPASWPAATSCVEVERLVNAAGIITLGSQVIQAGSPLAGQRARIRLDGQAMHVITQDGTLWRTLPCPIPPGQRHKLQGVRLAGPRPLPPASLVIQRKVSSRGGIQVARQRIQVGFSHAGKTVTIETRATALRIIDQHGELITTVPRAANGEISRFKAYGTRTTPARVTALQRPPGSSSSRRGILSPRKDHRLGRASGASHAMALRATPDTDLPRQNPAPIRKTDLSRLDDLVPTTRIGATGPAHQRGHGKGHGPTVRQRHPAAPSEAPSEARGVAGPRQWLALGKRVRQLPGWAGSTGQRNASASREDSR